MCRRQLGAESCRKTSPAFQIVISLFGFSNVILLEFVHCSLYTDIQIGQEMLAFNTGRARFILSLLFKQAKL